MGIISYPYWIKVSNSHPRHCKKQAWTVVISVYSIWIVLSILTIMLKGKSHMSVNHVGILQINLQCSE